MRVLLTRPEADSQRLAARLGDFGIPTLIWPLSRIFATVSDLEMPPGTEAIVFTSANAVTVFSDLVAVRDLPVYCVGDRTSAVARAAGFAHVESAAGDLTALADLLRRRPHRRLIYPSGREISADLGAALEGSGIMVDRRIIYAAEPGGPPPEEVRLALSAGEIGLVTVWSRRAATILADRLAELGEVPLGGTDLLAISPKAAEPLESLSFRRITIASRPDAGAMIAAISVAARHFYG